MKETHLMVQDDKLSWFGGQCWTKQPKIQGGRANEGWLRHNNKYGEYPFNTNGGNRLI